MRAEDIRIEELIDFSEGRVTLQGRRLIVHDMRAFAQFRRDLLSMLGPAAARRILTRFGYFSGNADAAAMERTFVWDSPAEWLRAGLRLHGLQGVARNVLKRLDLDLEAGRLRMEIVWHDSAEAEEHVGEFGPSQEPVCWMLAGYASGYASYCLGRPVYFIERRCVAKGDRVCSAEGRDEASWGTEIRPYLPYFQAEDIRGKIRKLTRDLRRRTQELAEHRQRVEILRALVRPALVEARSKAYAEVLDLAQRAAPFDTSVLITGETGVGKEVLARYIHENSARKDGPFLALNCGALPETLLESELFGHHKGAFTGAIADRVGLFEQAQKGTLFLDEIGDVTPSLQLKILRVLQEREVLRVGENRPRRIDVRVLAATNRKLEERIREGLFREDLYYRLRVIEIEVPPLRERREDILPLARHLVGHLAVKLGLPGLRLDASVLTRLENYDWPGNVRELENALERAGVLSIGGIIRLDDLPPHIRRAAEPFQPVSHGPLRTLAAVERDYIALALRQSGNNRTRAARVLGISPTTLWRKLGPAQDLLADLAPGD
jgi:DNA-binding NtrC family response regulator